MTEHDVMTPEEVAALFRVDVRTIARWDKDGLFGESVFRTLGGTRRFHRAKVMALLGQENEK